MVWLLCILVLSFSSCEQKPQERHYTEIIVDALPVNAPGAGIFSWIVPQGWEEVPGGDMRLASFHPLAGPPTIDCYITALEGPAGGLDANLERWLGQLGLQASDDNLKKLFASTQMLKTKDGLEIKVFDFTTLQNQGDHSAKSMLAAIIVLDKTTVFVKMTGPMGPLEHNKDNFLKLLGSFARK